METEREGLREGFKLEVEKHDAEKLASWKAARDVFDAAETARLEALPEGSENTYRRTYAVYGLPYQQAEEDWGVQTRIEAVLQQQIAVFGSW